MTTSDSPAPVRVALHGISRRYACVIANDRIDLANTSLARVMVGADLKQCIPQARQPGPIRINQPASLGRSFHPLF
jgi:hypothetical protein